MKNKNLLKFRLHRDSFVRKVGFNALKILNIISIYIKKKYFFLYNRFRLNCRVRVSVRSVKVPYGGSGGLAPWVRVRVR